MSRRVKALSATVVLLLLGGFAPPAQAAGEEWRLLYSDGALRDGTGTLKSEIPVNIDTDFPTARFSPDGSRMAVPEVDCLNNACDEVRGTVRIAKPDGTSALLAWVPDLEPKAVAWSADGSKVAVLGRTSTPDDIDVRIYVFPTNGSPATMVYSDTNLLRIEYLAGLSWSSADNRLAFIASEFVEDRGTYFAAPGGTSQVWTVAASASATPSRFSGTPVCGDCTHVPGYRQPTWSPDGSRLAIVSSDPTAPFGEEQPPFVGYLEEGALAADQLTDAFPQHQLAWSVDGSHLAYGIYDTSGDFYDETEIVDAETGARVGLVEDVIAPFVDWLPCPGGTCQVWQDVYTPPQPFMNIKGVVKRGKVVVSGELGRVPEVAEVRITLQKRARARAPWRKVTTVQVQAVEGIFKRSFAQPRAVQCRVRGVYEDGVARAEDTAVFRC
jgi:WD40 repeat protein